MFFNYDGLGISPFVWNCHLDTTVTSLEVSNLIVDEIKIDSTLEATNSIEKEEWGIDTELLAEFQNNLEAGNISSGIGIPIQYLRFKRRKADELTWQTMVELEYDSDIENYDMEDYYVQNGVSYEYTLVPVTQSFEGRANTSSILTDYKKLYLTGYDSDGNFCNYPLRFDLELSDITTNRDITTFKTLSSQYPIVRRGKTKYLSGNITADLISPTTEEDYGVITMTSENAYREAFEYFLNSDKPMLIRNHSFYILGTVDSQSKNPFSTDCAFGIWKYNLSFVETGGTDLTTLKKNNLTYSVTTS